MKKKVTLRERGGKKITKVRLGLDIFYFLIGENGDHSSRTYELLGDPHVRIGFFFSLWGNQGVLVAWNYKVVKVVKSVVSTLFPIKN